MAISRRDAVLDLLSASEKVATPGANSPLFLWLYKHHDDLVALTKGRRKSWIQMAKWFETEDILDGDGKPASPECARQTWVRVCRKKADLRVLPPMTQVLKPAFQADAEESTAKASDGSQPIPPKTSFQFEPAQPRGNTATLADVPIGVENQLSPCEPQSSGSGSLAALMKKMIDDREPMPPVQRQP